MYSLGKAILVDKLNAMQIKSQISRIVFSQTTKVPFTIKTWLSSVALGETSNIVITIGYFEDMKRSCWYISSFIRMHACIICNTKPLSATQINVSNVIVFPYQAIMTTWKSHIIMNEMPDHYHGETLHIISAV